MGWVLRFLMSGAVVSLSAGMGCSHDPAMHLEAKTSTFPCEASPACSVLKANVQLCRLSRHSLESIRAAATLRSNGWNADLLPDLTVGFPTEAHECLVARIGPALARIDDISRFRWLVSIDTEQDALDYVRFLSRPDVYYLVGFPAIEIRRTSNVAETYGGVTAHDWQRLRIPEATVSTLDDGYLVRRVLLWDDAFAFEGDQEIVLVEEYVGLDGLYLRRIVHVVASGDDCPRIRSPYFL